MGTKIKIPEQIHWDTWIEHILGEGMSFRKLRDIVSTNINDLQNRVGYDMPPSQDELFMQRFGAFMSMEFKGLAIKPELTEDDLYELTQSLKRHEERCYPSTDPGCSRRWDYYGPAFVEVEEGFREKDSERLRKGIDLLIDKRMHD